MSHQYGGELAGRTWYGRRWALSIGPSGLHLRRTRQDLALPADQLHRVSIRRKRLRWWLHVDGKAERKLPGLRPSGAVEILKAARLIPLVPRLEAASAWSDKVEETLQHHLTRQVWLDTETRKSLETSRPEQGLQSLLIQAGVLDRLTERHRFAASRLDQNLATRVDELNRQVVGRELQSQKEFFDSIEKSPLTTEQRLAVISYDNRVRLLAAAGSGKTSVMVARAAYAVKRGLAKPERILLLAFNRDAAAELKKRVKERFESVGLDHEGVRANTFHAFGLDCIAKATGEKPSLASWLEAGKADEKILELAAQLREEDPAFARAWDEFRYIYGPERHPYDSAPPDKRDRATKQTGYETLGGDIVKSQGERAIANWLYLNRIDYKYEQPYAVKTADAEHRQYRPDFYYPAADLWHEHWALDKNGRAPAEFSGYEASMAWKRDTHARNGTRLIETTSYDVWRYGTEQLERQLNYNGLHPSWDPSRAAKTQRALSLSEKDLTRLILTFMAHVKSSGLTESDTLAARDRLGESLAECRTSLFLDIYWALHDAWGRALADSGSIDYHDMLLAAAAEIRAGRHTPSTTSS
jgi:DNA helicase IV